MRSISRSNCLEWDSVSGSVWAAVLILQLLFHFRTVQGFQAWGSERFSIWYRCLVVYSHQMETKCITGRDNGFRSYHLGEQRKLCCINSVGSEYIVNFADKFLWSFHGFLCEFPNAHVFQLCTVWFKDLPSRPFRVICDVEGRVVFSQFVKW